MTLYSLVDNANKLICNNRINTNNKAIDVNEDNWR